MEVGRVGGEEKEREEWRDERGVAAPGGRGGHSHTRFASSLGVSFGLRGENDCSRPPKGRGHFLKAP